MSSTVDLSSLETVLASLPDRFSGPGGVVGIVENGRTLATQVWGYADMATGKAMDLATRLPICSISKQFTCAVLLDLVGDPARLDGRVADFLPLLEGRRPRVVDLCNMQSGLRDYWAMTVLHGAQPDGVFGRDDARPLLARMRTTHFEPGSSYSYSNGNFRILSDLLEEQSGRSLAELYAQRLFEPAGMASAVLTADTSVPADGVVGYEGNAATGYFPALNRIYWTGDAGISASLEDMLAWERYIDATRDDARGIYPRLSWPQTFNDGQPARYGFGLSHDRIGDVAVTGHGGALRGFRLQRVHAASRRLSVVVLFNHEADAHGAAYEVMRAALGQSEPPAGGRPADPDWNGIYLDEANGLRLAVSAAGEGLDVRYVSSPERLAIGADGDATSSSMRLERDGDTLLVTRPGENLKAKAVRVGGEARPDLAGRYFSREVEGFLDIEAAGGALYGRFEGLLGQGPMHPVHALGEDLFSLACPRSMDAPAPGDWTIKVRRGDAGRPRGLTVGCWLARNVAYERIG